MFSVASILLLVISACTIVRVKAHGYLESPRSRNYVAKQDGSWGGGDESTPKPETCPHCLNGGGGVTSGQCGITGNVNYDFPPNVSNGVMPRNIQATYERGQDIDVGIHITAHHKGHFEFFLCPIQYGQAPTRDCFWSHPLEFVEDLKYGAQKDPNYPYRAYIPPSTYGDLNYRYRLKLPNDVVGDLVLLQWWWVSANSCTAPGYNEYSFPPAWGPMGVLNTCNVSGGTINGAEQFWNCAEVQILNDGSPTSPQTPAPVIPPTSTPVKPPSPTPINSPTMAPVIDQTPSPNSNPITPNPVTSPTPAPIGGPIVYGNYCGMTWADAGKCGISCPSGNSTVCSFGEHCYADVSCTVLTNTPVASPVNPPVQSPTHSPVQGLEPCGGGFRGNGICQHPNHCCSDWGYCGSGSAWCGNRRKLRGNQVLD